MFIDNISKTILLLVLFNTAHGRKKQDKCHVNVIDVTKILLFDVLCFRKFIGEYIETFLLLGHSILHTGETKKINAMSM